MRPLLATDLVCQYVLSPFRQLDVTGSRLTVLRQLGNGRGQELTCLRREVLFVLNPFMKAAL